MRPDETLPARLLEKASRHPDRIFATVIGGGNEEALSFGELARRARAMAAALTEAGVRADDVVLLAFPTSSAYVVATFACQLLGVAIAPLPALTSEKDERVHAYAERLRFVASRSGACAAVVTSAVADALGRHLGNDELALVPVERLVESTAEARDVAPFDPDRIAVVQFSSGSTSAPKGVRITYRNIAANAAAIARRGEITSADRVLSFLPLFHDFGLFGGIIYPFAWDHDTWLAPTDEFIRRPSFWLKTLSRTRATICPAPQFVYQVTLHRARERDLEGVDLSAWRLSYNGGEPVHAPTLRAFLERFARYGLSPTTILPSYGMAESTLAIAVHPVRTPIVSEHVARRPLVEERIARPAVGDEPAVELVSCGPPLDGIDLAILDDGGDALEERAIGEIAVRGDSVARTYVVGPGETVPLERDGWFRTGDLGYLSDGNLYVAGRVKDLIIRGGSNYFPQDIERLVEPLEGVRLNGVVAFGVYDDVEGAERVVVVVERGTMDESLLASLPERVRRAVFEGLDLTVDDVAVRDKGWVPKTTSAKLQRSKARARYLAESRDEAGA